jgi:hypothetical protein
MSSRAAIGLENLGGQARKQQKTGENVRGRWMRQRACLTAYPLAQDPPRPITPPPYIETPSSRPVTPSQDVEMVPPTPKTPSTMRRIVQVLTPRRLISRMHRAFDEIVVPASEVLARSIAAVPAPPTFPHLPVSPPTPPSVPKWVAPPAFHGARKAYEDVHAILHPKRCKGVKFVKFEGDDLLRSRLEMVRMCLLLYTHPNVCERLTWINASLRTASSFGKSSHTAQRIREWSRAFMDDRGDLPLNLYGVWTVSMLDKDGLAREVFEHLQSVGKYVTAMDIVWFLDNSEVRARHGLKNNISLATAKRWMHTMNYRWTKTPTGMLHSQVQSSVLLTLHRSVC